MNRQNKAREKLERKAARGPGFSNYAERKLNQLIADKIEEDELLAEEEENQVGPTDAN